MEDSSELIGLPDNPLGRRTFDSDKFIDYFIGNSAFSFDDITNIIKNGNLTEIVGSRIHSWRIMLGII